MPAAGLTLAAAFFLGSNCRAGEVALQAVRDNTLIESPFGTVSNGSGSYFFAGRNSQANNSIRRGVIAFDVAAAIPPGAKITAATLTLNMSQTNAGPVEVSLHRLTAAWGEGDSAAAGGGGAPAAPGDATWLHAFYPDRPWSAAGGDFEPPARAVATVDQPGPYTWGPTAEMTADVQGWLDDPSTAHGWILLGDETAPTTVKRFDSRESADAAMRPVLTVTFTPLCRPRYAGAGYWARQCRAAGAEGSGPGDGPEGGLGTGPGTGPGGGPGAGLGVVPTFPGEPVEGDFTDRILPCAGALLDSLGAADVPACAAVGPPAPSDCAARVLRRMATLAFNLCAGRLQPFCPFGARGGACATGDATDLLRDLAERLAAGDCPSSCAWPED